MAAVDEVSRLWHLTGCPCLADCSDFSNASRPAPAEGSERAEVLQEGHAGATNAVDQRVVVLVRLQRRKRAHAEDAVNAAGIGRPQRLLKPHDRATGTGIHRAVKNYFS